MRPAPGSAPMKRPRFPILALPLAAAVALSACQKDSDPGPGGVTRGEARALDEAAAMLDSRPPAPLQSQPVADPSGKP